MPRLPSFAFSGSALARLARDKKGNVAIVLGLSILPLMTMFGVAIDYGRVVRARAALQNTADAAALDLSLAARYLKKEKLKERARAFVEAIGRGEAIDIVGDPAVSEARTSVCLTLATSVKTLILQVVSAANANIRAESCASFGAGNMEIALAFDNTGSMQATDRFGVRKIDALKTTAKALIDALIPAGPDGERVKISLVPFAAAVNVGTGYAGANWVDLGGQSSIHWENFPKVPGGSFSPVSRFDLFRNMGVAWGGCFEERPGVYALGDQPASLASPDSLFVPLLAPDESDSLPRLANNGGISMYNNNYLEDYGNSICAPGDAHDLADRRAPYFGDGQSKLCKYKAAPGKTLRAVDKLVPGPNRSCDTKPLLTLTDNSSALKSGIDEMEPVGSTNLVSGLMWAWRTISPNGPFPGVKPYDEPANQKILILMTDGSNAWLDNDANPNKSEYTSFGYFWNNRLGTAPVGRGGAEETISKSNMFNFLNYKTLYACYLIRQAGVTIYTVGVNTGNDIDRFGALVLSSCAGDASRAYMATDTVEFAKAFADIAGRISPRRLSK